jgi:uncharacterized protein YozE (UPF0346 family)
MVFYLYLSFGIPIYNSKNLTELAKNVYNMQMKIKQATDFHTIFVHLKSELKALNYNPDLNKMLKNIQIMVEDLSKLEVEARRKQKFTYTEIKANEINNAIDHLEKLILIAKLMQ